jgi:hypothetical protein
VTRTVWLCGPECSNHAGRTGANDYDIHQGLPLKRSALWLGIVYLSQVTVIGTVARCLTGYRGLLMTPAPLVPWRSDWLWSIPLIVVTIVFHSSALGLLSRGLLIILKDDRKKRLPRALSILVVGGSSLCTIFLHGLEAGMWAVAYHLLGTLGGGDRKDAMLFSTSVMTTVGGTPLHLQPGWALMGPLEALDGWILFGLTAAFLFALIQKVWSLEHS